MAFKMKYNNSSFPFRNGDEDENTYKLGVNELGENVVEELERKKLEDGKYFSHGAGKGKIYKTFKDWRKDVKTDCPHCLYNKATK